VNESLHQRRACRSDHFMGQATAMDRDSFQQRNRSRGREGDLAVLCLQKSGAQRQIRCVKDPDSQVFDAENRSCNVNDRIHGADLVKADFFGRTLMDDPFHTAMDSKISMILFLVHRLRLEASIICLISPMDLGTCSPAVVWTRNRVPWRWFRSSRRTSM